MATTPGAPPPDTINPQSPPESPPDPLFAPSPAPPEVAPEVPGIDQPDCSPEEWQAPN
jgi:hypothetical protein